MQQQHKTEEDCINQFMGYRIWLSDEVRKWEEAHPEEVAQWKNNNQSGEE